MAQNRVILGDWLKCRDSHFLTGFELFIELIESYMKVRLLLTFLFFYLTIP